MSQQSWQPANLSPNAEDNKALQRHKFIFFVTSRTMTSQGRSENSDQSPPLHPGRDPFNQNFRKFRSKTQWIGSVQPEKFRKNGSTFRGGPLFPVGPVGILVEWIALCHLMPTSNTPSHARADRMPSCPKTIMHSARDVITNELFDIGRRCAYLSFKGVQ